MSEDLTAAQLAQLTAALRSLVAELEGGLDAGAAEGSIVHLDQTAVGRVSRVDALQQQSMAQATAARARTRLGLARQALDALETDDYGFCRECGDNISFRRLTVRPEAPFCVPCAAAKGR